MARPVLAVSVSMLSVVVLAAPAGPATATATGYDVAHRRPITWVQVGPSNSGYRPPSLLSQRGHVAFTITDDDLSRRAALWDRGKTTEVAPGAPFPTEPYAVNERRTIVGTMYPYGAGGLAQAFVWSHGVLRSVGVADENSRAMDVNERNEVLVNRAPVGSSYRASLLGRSGEIVSPLVLDGQTLEGVAMNDRGQVLAKASGSTAFLWEPGSEPIVIDGLGSHNYRVDSINNRGSVVGEFDADDLEHTFIWRHGEMVDLGTLGGPQTHRNWESPPDRLNDRDQVTGSADTADGTVHAFLWTEGHMLDLGTLGPPDVWGASSWGMGINDRGEVVGETDTVADGLSAFLWRDGTMIDLGTLLPEDSLSAGLRINNRGQVLGGTYRLIGGVFTADLVLWNTRNRG